MGAGFGAVSVEVQFPKEQGLLLMVPHPTPGGHSDLQGGRGGGRIQAGQVRVEALVRGHGARYNVYGLADCHEVSDASSEVFQFRSDACAEIIGERLLFLAIRSVVVDSEEATGQQAHINHVGQPAKKVVQDKVVDLVQPGGVLAHRVQPGEVGQPLGRGPGPQAGLVDYQGALADQGQVVLSPGREVAGPGRQGQLQDFEVAG